MVGVVFVICLLLYTLCVALLCLGFRGFIVSLLNVYRKCNVLWAKLTGKLNDRSAVERRVITGEAWSQYCDTLKASGATLLSSGCPTDPLNQGEGYRYLTRLVRVSLEVFMECADRENPQLVALANGLRAAPVKIGSDNPDNLYQNAMIDSRENYLLTGNRGTVFYLGFGTQSGVYGKRGGLQTVMNKEISDMNVGEDGKFEIIISVDPPKDPSKNWMKLAGDPAEAMLIVRQTFNDRDTEIPASFNLSLMSRDSAPSSLTCQAVDDALKTSGMFVAGASMMFARWAKGFQGHVNELPLFDQAKSNRVGGDPAIRYYHSYWRLEDPSDCLVIRTKITPCHTWNFQLNNHWMESLDYRYFNIHTNSHLATYRTAEKAEVIIVISHKRPQNYTEVPVTYIQTVEHKQGTMCFRWIRPGVTDDQLNHPKMTLVALKDLNDFIK